MTPTAEWYEADEDDSDRSITDDVTASTHETARAATETGETRVHGDADLLRKRTAALDRVAAELAEARAEVERLRMDVSHRSSTTAWQQRRAEAAEAKLRDVEALADEWVGVLDGVLADDATPRDLLDDLRAALARSQAPQAPAEQEGRSAGRCTCWPSGDDDDDAGHDGDCGIWDGHPFPAPSVRPATADDEGVW